MKKIKVIKKDENYYLTGPFTPRTLKQKQELLIYSLHENSQYYYPNYNNKVFKEIIKNSYFKKEIYPIPNFIFQYKEINKLIDTSIVSSSLIKNKEINITAKLDKIIFVTASANETLTALNNSNVKSSMVYGYDIFFTCKNMKGIFNIFMAEYYIIDEKHQIVAKLDKDDLKILKDCLKIMEYKKIHRKAKRKITNIINFHKAYPNIKTKLLTLFNLDNGIKHVNIKKAIAAKYPVGFIEKIFLNVKKYNKMTVSYLNEDYYYYLEDVIENQSIIMDYILKDEIKNMKEILSKAENIHKIEDPRVIKELEKSNFNAVLRPHQKIGVSWLANLFDKGIPGAILADDMGMGKTIQSIAFVSYLIITKKIKNVLIIAPVSVIGVWAEEIKKFNPSINNKFKIQSYEASRDKSLDSDLIILDEGQKVKNNKTLAAQALVRAKAKFKLILSGTPIENSITDIFSLITIISSDTEKILQKILKITKDPLHQIKLTSKIFKPLLLSRKMSTDILPIKLEKEIVRVTLSLTEKEIYDNIKKFFSKKLTSIKNNNEFYRQAIVALLRMMQAVGSPKSLPDELFTPKIRNLKNNLAIDKISKIKYLKNLILKHKQDKFVIFVRFQDNIKTLKKIYPDALVIDGSITKENRTETVKKFQKGYIQIIIISLQAGATGLTLTSANKLVFYDLWWNPAVMEQAVRRIYRIGQIKDCKIYYLVAKNTIDDLIMHSLNTKNILISTFENNGKTENLNKAKIGKENSKGAIEIIDNIFKH